MLAEQIEDPERTTPASLLDRYAEELASVVQSVGAERTTEEAGVEPDTVTAIGARDVENLDLRDAVSVLALSPDSPDPQAILADVRDRLLLEMSNAMLTVDRIAADLERDLDPAEVQGMIEGRHPMSLGEYARLHHYVAASK